MKTARTLILSSAAVLAAFGGAQAADLPVKAKAIEYVRICSAYGAGFFYIPGTDTCLKIGGYLRADTSFNVAGAHGQPAWSGDLGQQNRYRDYFVDRSRMVLSFDTRTANTAWSAPSVRARSSSPRRAPAPSIPRTSRDRPASGPTAVS